MGAAELAGAAAAEGGGGGAGKRCHGEGRAGRGRQDPAPCRQHLKAQAPSGPGLWGRRQVWARSRPASSHRRVKTRRRRRGEKHQSRQRARGAQKDTERGRDRLRKRQKDSQRMARLKEKGRKREKVGRERDTYKETEGETETQRATKTRTRRQRQGCRDPVKRMEIKRQRQTENPPRGKNPAGGAVHILPPGPLLPSPGSSGDRGPRVLGGMVSGRSHWGRVTNLSSNAASQLAENSRPRGCGLQPPLLCSGAGVPGLCPRM